jgi:hypothetical protein
MVPEGVAEVWTVPISLKNGQNYYPNFAERFSISRCYPSTLGRMEIVCSASRWFSLWPIYWLLPYRRLVWFSVLSKLGLTKNKTQGELDG